MLIPCFRPAAVGAVISGILAGPAQARAQGVTALSAVGFPILAAKAVEIRSRQPQGDPAATLSAVGLWRVAGVVLTGGSATLVLRNGDGATQACLVLPARAVAGAGLRAGDSVQATASEAGAILHKDERVVAFVAGEDQAHLVHHDAIART
jgi:hypothetical protein